MKLDRETADRFLLWFAIATFAVSVIGWPLSQATVASDEPPFTLGLSWFAVVQGSLVFIVSALIRKDGNEDNSSGPE